VISLEGQLRAVRDNGRKALVPYIVAGTDDAWKDYVRAAAFAGATAIEIGIPFSDPMMDGVIIQEASDKALRNGATFGSILQEMSDLEVEVPLLVMTYYNIFHHYGLERASIELAEVGVTGAIVPDLSLEEIDQWQSVVNRSDIATVLMVAPSTPRERVTRLADRTQGFAYAQGRMSVTGMTTDDGNGGIVVERIREVSDVPVYIGIGVSTAEQASAAASVSDGVIVGSALVRRILDGEGAIGVEKFVGELRRAID
jgi:tryptophan synthase alpha chain